MGPKPNPKTRVLGRDKTQVFGFQKWRVIRTPGAPGLHSLDAECRLLPGVYNAAWYRMLPECVACGLNV